MSIVTDREIVQQLTRIANYLRELVFLELNELRNPVTDFTLSQLRGDTLMPISGVVVGATGGFTIGFVPATNFIPLPSPPTVSVDDTNVTLSAVDPTAFSFTATVSSTDTGASFNITVSGVNDKGAALTHVFNVPILPAPPPPPVSITDFSLNQTS